LLMIATSNFVKIGGLTCNIITLNYDNWGGVFKRKIKASPYFLQLASPYFAHGASCAKLKIEWTPLWSYIIILIYLIV